MIRKRIFWFDWTSLFLTRFENAIFWFDWISLFLTQFENAIFGLIEYRCSWLDSKTQFLVWLNIAVLDLIRKRTFWFDWTSLFLTWFENAIFGSIETLFWFFQILTSQPVFHAPEMITFFVCIFFKILPCWARFLVLNIQESHKTEKKSFESWPLSKNYGLGLLIFVSKLLWKTKVCLKKQMLVKLEVYEKWSQNNRSITHIFFNFWNFSIIINMHVRKNRHFSIT